MYGVKSEDGEHCFNRNSVYFYRAYSDTVLNCDFDQVRSIIIEDKGFQGNYLKLKQIMIFKEPDLGVELDFMTVDGLESNLPHTTDQQNILFGESSNSVEDKYVEYLVEGVPITAPKVEIILLEPYKIKLLGISVKGNGGARLPLIVNILGHSAQINNGEVNWFNYDT